MTAFDEKVSVTYSTDGHIYLGWKTSPADGGVATGFMSGPAEVEHLARTNADLLAILTPEEHEELLERVRGEIKSRPNG